MSRDGGSSYLFLAARSPFIPPGDEFNSYFLYSYDYLIFILLFSTEFISMLFGLVLPGDIYYELYGFFYDSYFEYYSNLLKY